MSRYSILPDLNWIVECKIIIRITQYDEFPTKINSINKTNRIISHFVSLLYKTAYRNTNRNNSNKHVYRMNHLFFCRLK